MLERVCHNDNEEWIHTIVTQYFDSLFLERKVFPAAQYNLINQICHYECVENRQIICFNYPPKHDTVNAIIDPLHMISNVESFKVRHTTTFQEGLSISEVTETETILLSPLFVQRIIKY